MKVTLSKKTDTKADESNTTVTVIGVDTTDMDTTAGKDANSVSSSGSSHGKVGFTFESDDNDLPFGNLSDMISGGILFSIIAIVAVFGLPVFILFVIFFFRYKNRKARYRLAEQAIAAGQPLPENFIRENRPADQRSQGIKNTFTGIGLFIFLWAITGEFGIGAIGLLIMFMGIGQWIIGSKQQKTDDVDPFRMNVSRKETSTPGTILLPETISVSETIPPPETISTQPPLRQRSRKKETEKRATKINEPNQRYIASRTGRSVQKH